MFRDDDFGLLDLLEIALGFPGACLGEAGVQCAEDLRDVRRCNDTRAIYDCDRPAA
jgi:hypothetical protein